MRAHVEKVDVFGWTKSCVILTISKTTQIELEPKNWSFLGKSLYIRNTPQLFSMVSIPIVDHYMCVPNIHKCKLSTDKILSQQSKRYKIFQLVAGLEVTFLYAELRYQPWWWLGATGSVELCHHCIVPVLLISCHYRCRYLVTTTGVVFQSSLNRQPHRSNQNIEYSSVSFCILGIHLNCFQWSLVQS